METQQINPDMKNFLNSDLFREIENKVVGEAVSEANKTARKELELFKFEMLYPQFVPKKEREEIEKEIIKLREKKWKKALKNAKGDEEKALRLL